MKRCYEYFECKQTDCPARKIPDNKQCWEVKGTLCNSHGVEEIDSILGGRLYACENCSYYQSVMPKKTG